MTCTPVEFRRSNPHAGQVSNFRGSARGAKRRLLKWLPHDHNPSTPSGRPTLSGTVPPVLRPPGARRARSRPSARPLWLGPIAAAGGSVMSTVMRSSDPSGRGPRGRGTSVPGREPGRSRGGSDAFISYRRADATLVAHWLRHQLRHFRFPVELRSRGYRSPDCFVDKLFRRSTSDFFDHGLAPRLRTAPFLILVMSPRVMEPLPTGEKNWVQKELEEFLAHQSADQVLIALASGPFTQPLPAVLANRSDIADLRGVRFWRRLLPPRPPSPRTELIPIVARMCSVPDADLPLLYREERRRKWQLTIRLSLVAITIMVLLSLLSFWAVTEARNVREALVRAHLSRASAALNTDPAASQFALLQAVQAASGRWPILRPALNDEIVRFWLSWWRNRPVPRVAWHHDAAYSVLLRGHHGISGGADGVVFSVSLREDQVHEIGRLLGGPAILVEGTGTSFAAFERSGPLVLGHVPSSGVRSGRLIRVGCITRSS